MFSTLDHHPLLSEPLEWRTGELEGSGDLKGQDEKYIVGVGGGLPEDGLLSVLGTIRAKGLGGRSFPKLSPEMTGMWERSRGERPS